MILGTKRTFNNVGFHADGENDHVKALRDSPEHRCYRELVIHRFNRWCHPRSPVGFLRLYLRRARILRKPDQQRQHTGSLF